LDPIYSSGLFLALASAELAAECVHEALRLGDTSAARLGAFAQPLTEWHRTIRLVVAMPRILAGPNHVDQHLQVVGQRPQRLGEPTSKFGENGHEGRS
jgi:hypothetical protein